MPVEDLNHSALVLLDRFFLVFHCLYVLFTVLGWIWRRTRRIHLLICLFTLFSWLVLGFWYGFGYCFLTHWHWDVRIALDDPPGSSSYIHFLIREITALDLDPALVDQATVVVFSVCLLLSVLLNYRDFRSRKA